LDQLWLKDDTLNPSGSTKDRASWLVLAKAMQKGHDTVATASTGNAATSLACLAAAADLRAVTLVPATTPAAKLVQMSIYGAQVLAIEGNYDQAYELCLQACDEFSWYNRNTALNPFTLEGKKSAALEIAAQLAPQEADVVLVPTGDGVILAGLAKGFADLERCGLLSRQPRLIAVQPEGASALVKAFAAGDKEVPLPQKDDDPASSIADSLVVEVARGAIPCLQALRSSGGTGVRVSEEKILEAMAMLAKNSGVFAEPAAAAALAGLLVARQQGLVEQDETIVLMVTGTGLKNLPAARRTFKPAAPLAPNLAAISERLFSLAP
jgi:threonine synthase